MANPAITGESNPVQSEKQSLINKLFGDRIGHQRFSPGAMQQIADEYLPTLGLGKDVTFSAEAFANHMKGRTQDFKGLKEAKTPAGEAIHTKLLQESTDSDRKNAIDTIRDHLNDALKPSQAFTDAKTDYEENIATFKDLLKEVPKKYRVVDLIGAMKDIIDTGRKKIEEQQKQEIELLNKKFQEPDFNKNLITALVITDEQVEEVKKSLTDDLTSTHKKQIEEFDKSTTESLNKLHKASEGQMKEFLLLADLYRNDSKMRNEIENLAIKNRAELLKPQKDALTKNEKSLTEKKVTFEQTQKILDTEQKTLTKEQKALTSADPTGVDPINQANQEALNEKLADLKKRQEDHETERKIIAEQEKAVKAEKEALDEVDLHTEAVFDGRKVDISSVRLEQLQFIQRDGGEKIQRNPNGSYTLEMGMRFTNPRYYFNDQDKKDLLTLAQVIRATGSTSITMKITADNPKVAEQRARAAYEACIKSGFPPEKIKLVVNDKLLAHKEVEKDDKDGKPYKSIAKELFANKQNQYLLLQENSKKIQEELDKVTQGKNKPAKEPDLEKIKEDIQKARETTKANKTPKEETPKDEDTQEPKGPRQ